MRFPVAFAGYFSVGLPARQQLDAIEDIVKQGTISMDFLSKISHVVLCVPGW